LSKIDEENQKDMGDQLLDQEAPKLWNEPGGRSIQMSISPFTMYLE
jgi:hypothetical protein